jgi:ABC-type multidrug transport system ATPase subunit
MKCRLSIAKWQLLEPALLLVDEPYGVLDGTGVDLLERYLTRVCREGGLVVIATHDVRRAAALCSRAIILKRGRVSFDEPKRPRWESFDAAVGDFLPRGEAWSS